MELYYRNHPISKVELVGIVKSIKSQSKKVVITLDDGTGSISCIFFKFDDQEIVIPLELEVGNLISIRGTIGKVETNESPYDFVIHVKKLDILHDPNIETLHITDVILFDNFEYDNVLSTYPSTMFSRPLPSWLIESQVKVLSWPCNTPDSIKSKLLYCLCMSCPCTSDQSGKFRIEIIQYFINNNIPNNITYNNMK